MSHTQKASILPKKQGSLEVRDWPIPTINDNEILVKIESAALNPIDSKILNYGIIIEEFPAILGFDGAGIVEAVGSKVEKFKKGDRIVYPGIFGSAPNSTFQQYGVTTADFAGKIPNNITFDQAASFPVAAFTATVALYDGFKLTPPWNNKHTNFEGKEYILIWGGATNVGQFVIQLAKLSGLNIITTASRANHDHLKALGANHVFDYHDSSVIEQIKAITGDNLVYAVDTVGSASTLQAWKALSSNKHAHLITVSVVPDVSANPEKKQVTIKSIIAAPKAHPELATEFWSAFEKYTADGTLVPNGVEVLDGGLAGIENGLDLLKAGKVSMKKLVVHPQETA